MWTREIDLVQDLKNLYLIDNEDYLFQKLCEAINCKERDPDSINFYTERDKIKLLIEDLIKKTKISSK